LHYAKWQIRWLLLASLAYGLAIGARPTFLFGAPIVLIPVLRMLFESTWRDSWRRISWCFFAATIPLALVGLGLMLYNFLRFDNPLEFGWHYQLVNGRNYGVQPLSWHYWWFNFWFYFLEPVRWTSGFPFLKPMSISPLPPGHIGIGIPYGGTLSNYPIVWLALATCLAAGTRLTKRASALTWFIGAVFFLFAVCAATICFYTGASTRYQFDFLPYLMLLASIGILCLEQALAHLNTRRYVARGIWCLLLAYSIVFNLFASVDAHANANYIAGNFFSNQGDMDEAIEYFKKASETEPDSANYHFALGNALLQSGQIDEAILQYQDALKISPNDAQANNNIAYAFMKKGQPSQAIIYFQEALKNNPGYEAYYNLADAFRRSGNAPQAIAGYQKAIDLQPGFIPAEKSLAWMLATCSDPALRDGARAVTLAEKADQLAGGRDPGILRVLAAAYAEAGRFNEAVAAAKKAQSLAAAQSNTALVNELQIEISLYQKGAPFNPMKK
jgi:tetratricopeptide (TPR) repeat protein